MQHYAALSPVLAASSATSSPPLAADPPEPLRVGLAAKTNNTAIKSCQSQAAVLIMQAVCQVASKLTRAPFLLALAVRDIQQQ